MLLSFQLVTRKSQLVTRNSYFSISQTAKVDKVLCKFKTHSITKTNELFYAGAAVVTNRLGVKINKATERKEPMWRRRLQNKIKELRKDLAT